MRNRIASLLGMPSLSESAELVGRDELGRVLGIPQRQALELTQRADFPEPTLSLHRREPTETLPQPQPTWRRSELERWLKQHAETQQQD